MNWGALIFGLAAIVGIVLIVRHILRAERRTRTLWPYEEGTWTPIPDDDFTGGTEREP